MRSFILGLLLAASVLLTRSQAQTHVEFNTTLGPLLVELYDTEKPQTVKSFLNIVTNDIFQEVFFHSWGAGQALAGGGFVLPKGYATNAEYQGSSYRIFEIAAPLVTNEVRVGRLISNTFGTLAKDNTYNFSRTHDPVFSKTPFFINLADSPYLDTFAGGFTVFGKVIGNTNLLGLFNFDPGTHGVYVTNVYGTGKPGPFFAWPTLTAGSVLTKDLIFIHPHVINTEIRATFDHQAQTVSFNTLSNYTHVLEVSTNLGTGWKLVTFALGTGSKISITDNSTNQPFRIYRVRLE